MHVYMHVCMYACMHVCMHAHTPHMHTCIHASSTCQSNIVTFEARCAQRTHTCTHISTLEKTFALAPCRERAGDRPKQRTAHTYKDTYKDTCTGEGQTQLAHSAHISEHIYGRGTDPSRGARNHRGELIARAYCRIICTIPQSEIIIIAICKNCER